MTEWNYLNVPLNESSFKYIVQSIQSVALSFHMEVWLNEKYHVLYGRRYIIRK